MLGPSLLMRKKLEYPPLGRPSVRSSVLTITFKENRMIKKINMVDHV